MDVDVIRRWSVVLHGGLVRPKPLRDMLHLLPHRAAVTVGYRDVLPSTAPRDDDSEAATISAESIFGALNDSPPWRRLVPHRAIVPIIPSSRRSRQDWLFGFFDVRRR